MAKKILMPALTPTMGSGVIAGAFLRSLQSYLEHPARLFLES